MAVDGHRLASCEFICWVEENSTNIQMLQILLFGYISLKHLNRLIKIACSISIYKYLNVACVADSDEMFIMWS